MQRIARVHPRPDKGLAEVVVEGAKLGSPVTVTAVVGGKEREFFGSAIPGFPIEVRLPDHGSAISVELSDDGKYFVGAGRYVSKPGRFELFSVSSAKLTGPVNWDNAPFMTDLQQIVFANWELRSGTLPRREWDLTFFLEVDGVIGNQPFHQQKIFSFATANVQPAKFPERARAEVGQDFSLHAVMRRTGHVITFECRANDTANHTVGTPSNHVLDAN